MNEQLARLARDTVNAASRATLTIYGGHAGADSAVTGLHADNGWPVFWCAPESAVAAAAGERQTAVVTVYGPAGVPETVTVLLAGRLEVIGRRREHGRPVAAIALIPAQVLVETCAAGRPVVSQAVPTADYADADPGWLAARAAQLAAHTNDSHGPQLRSFAAAHAGLLAADVAAAWLATLDENGALLSWMDATGSHALAVSFPRPARTSTELALMLREELAPGSREARRDENDSRR